jgi:hypothetical protein
MARIKVKENKQTNNDVSEAEPLELIDESLDDSGGEESEQVETVELADIPIDQFLKDPKMSEITEDGEIEEITAWCPVCNEHTIFANKICTSCGFEKGSKSNTDAKEETEESLESTFDLIPSDEVIEEMNGFGGFGDEEGSSDDY